jgi:protein-tyrosine phosphatase
MTNVIFLCTGNAARSVMATVMARDRAPSLSIRGAGTLSIPDLPMSQRTRIALQAMGLEDREHRSHQLDTGDTQWADVIVAFEPDHIRYLRRHHPEASGIAATLPRLIRDLDDTASPLRCRLHALGLGQVAVDAWEEVIDPAGGDQDVFHACAAEISALVDALLPRLAESTL